MKRRAPTAREIRSVKEAAREVERLEAELEVARRAQYRVIHDVMGSGIDVSQLAADVDLSRETLYKSRARWRDHLAPRLT